MTNRKTSPEELERRLSRLRILSRIMAYTAMILAAVSFFFAGPHIEARLFPVIPTFRITQIDHLPDGSA